MVSGQITLVIEKNFSKETDAEKYKVELEKKFEATTIKANNYLRVHNGRIKLTSFIE